ncbi:MAG TPA: formylmethanofuran dehydrogenase subunit C [Anaerolineae bacterium]|nr:formylmethanofuran dehydrogenase subunit C [Anaerolineae bacterium]
MNPVTFTLKEQLPTPLEAEVISPDLISELPQADILKQPVFLGNRQFSLGDFFEVEGEYSDCLELYGDLTRVKWLGRGMTRGSIVIHGNAGMHLGAYMAGGTITVHGDSGDWLGAEMSEGRIRVHGKAGGQVGAAYRGSKMGMQGGEILVDGSAGIEVGMRMRRGLICIQGRVGDFAGLQMKGGTLFLFGRTGIRTGAWMTRGTIVAFEPLPLLPTFIYACTYNPTFLRFYLNHLQNLAVPFPEYSWSGLYERFTGDTSGLGKGEILVCQPPVVAA